MKEQVLQAMREAGKPVSAGEVTKVLNADCSPLCKLEDGTTVFYAREFSEQKSDFFRLDSQVDGRGDCTIPKFLVLNRSNALNAWKVKKHLIIEIGNVLFYTLFQKPRHRLVRNGTRSG